MLGELVLAVSLAVCARGEAAEQAVDLWRAAGVPLVRSCPGDVYVYAVPELRPGIGGFATGRIAFCIRLPGVCAHELGHLMGLDHPNEYGCAGRWEDPTTWTVMDYSMGCPGQMYGPFWSDGERANAALEAR